jgi:hypothetical protein
MIRAPGSSPCSGAGLWPAEHTDQDERPEVGGDDPVVDAESDQAPPPASTRWSTAIMSSPATTMIMSTAAGPMPCQHVHM